MSMPLAPQIAPFDYRLIPSSVRRIPESRMKLFFGKIIPLKFPSVKDASATCRALAKDFGFTLKQETSSSKNIYLYCSREGIPDSRKGNKPIKRKRASIRCDCKWRIILFQNDVDKQWEFRQSQNPQHCEHNHELIPPELMPRPWPSSMLERIAYYVNLGVRTNEIRTAIQREFPDQPWDERRFYNRLSDERKKAKARETEKRVNATMSMAARVASVACSSKECTDKVLAVLQRVYYEICDIAKINPEPAENGFVSSPSPNDFSVNYPSCVINVKNLPSRPGKKNQSTSESIPQSKSIINHNVHTDTLIQQEQERRSALEYTAHPEKSPMCEEPRVQRQLLVSTKMDESILTNYSSRIMDKESTVSDASSFDSCNGAFHFERSVKEATETHSNELIVNEDSDVQLTSIDQNMRGLRFVESSRNVDYTTSEVKSGSDEVDNGVRFVIPSNAAASVSNGSQQMAFVTSDPYNWALYHTSMRQRIPSSRLSLTLPEELNITTSMQRQSSLNYSQQYSQTCSPQSIPDIQHNPLSSDQLSAQQYQQTHYNSLQPVWYA